MGEDDGFVAVGRGELQPPEVSPQPGSPGGIQSLTLRALKRAAIRMVLKEQYRCLDPVAVEKILPAVGDYATKRSWEKAMHDARAQLRELSGEVKSGEPLEV